MAVEPDFVPYIPAEKKLPELTIKAILVGLILTVIMAAANAYLGLYAGMTVSATIPSVVMAVAFFKILKGNILEVNLSKSMAVTGEALAAGIIFTFPALLILSIDTGGYAGWANLWGYMGLVIAGSLLGGIIGILFTIPLRKVMIEGLELPYPEGVASAEVLKAIDKGGKGMIYITMALATGLIYKFVASDYGLRIFRENIEGTVGDNPRLYGGIALSPALLGVGYILGLRIAGLVFTGGVIGWIIMIPIVGAFVGFPAPGVDGVMEIWADYTMYVGIGAIVTGGIYTIITLRKPIVEGVRQSMDMGQAKTSAASTLRTEHDFPIKKWYFVGLFLSMIVIYWWATASGIVAGLAAIVLLVAAFFFTAVAGYLAGIVGSSNNPISGVTVITILFTALLLLAVAAAGFVSTEIAMTATIIAGAVVCCSAAIAGDSMQELKTAQLIGATPYNIQISRFIGVISAAILVPPIVATIISAYGIVYRTTAHPNPLKAPQAKVMSSITLAIFQGIPLSAIIMFVIGVILAIVLIVLKQPVMAVAIGIYLPFTLTLPIMLGGVIKHVTDRYIKEKVHTTRADMTEEERKGLIQTRIEQSTNTGILFASGLVAGEALMGVIIAVFVMAHINLTIFGTVPLWTGLVVFLYIGLLLAYVVVRKHVEGLGELKYLFMRRK